MALQGAMGMLGANAMMARPAMTMASRATTATTMAMATTITTTMTTTTTIGGDDGGEGGQQPQPRPRRYIIWKINITPVPADPEIFAFCLGGPKRPLPARKRWGFAPRLFRWLLGREGAAWTPKILEVRVRAEVFLSRSPRLQSLPAVHAKPLGTIAHVQGC